MTHWYYKAQDGAFVVATMTAGGEKIIARVENKKHAELIAGLPNLMLVLKESVAAMEAIAKTFGGIEDKLPLINQGINDALYNLGMFNKEEK